jgi:tRNA G10  N-methylase Trm11
MLNNSSPDQAVYEPFLGSGTSIIAAETTGRSCHAIEISPAYVDVAITRWQDFTGKSATLADDGRSFAEVTEERLDGNQPSAPSPVAPTRGKISASAAGHCR